MKHSWILIVDAVINLVLGMLLVIAPFRVIAFFGLPKVIQGFYLVILGAVLTGIGISLLIEAFRRKGNLVGLGLGGAIAINLCGGVALAGWLLFGRLDIPLRGVLFLWGLVVVLVVVSGIELGNFLVRKHKT